MNHHDALTRAHDRYWDLVENATSVKVQMPPALPSTPVTRGLASRLLRRLRPQRTAKGLDRPAPTTKPAV